MQLRVKVMMRNGGPVALLCDSDSPLNYWNEPDDAAIALVARDVWTPDANALHGGNFEPRVSPDTVAEAHARLQDLTGQDLPLVVCASMQGRISD